MPSKPLNSPEPPGPMLPSSTSRCQAEEAPGPPARSCGTRRRLACSPCPREPNATVWWRCARREPPATCSRGFPHTRSSGRSGTALSTYARGPLAAAGPWPPLEGSSRPGSPPDRKPIRALKDPPARSEHGSWPLASVDLNTILGLPDLRSIGYAIAPPVRPHAGTTPGHPVGQARSAELGRSSGKGGHRAVLPAGPFFLLPPPGPFFSPPPIMDNRGLRSKEPNVERDGHIPRCRREHTARPYSQRHPRHPSNRAGQVGDAELRRKRQGSHRPADDRGGRASGPPQAGRDHHRTHVR